jgi:hypothetical protein
MPPRIEQMRIVVVEIELVAVPIATFYTEPIWSG